MKGFSINASVWAVTQPDAEISGFRNLLSVPGNNPNPAPPPATGIFSPLMDGAVSEFQLRKLKRLRLKPDDDSDKGVFYYGIHHSVLHGYILPL